MAEQKAAQPVGAAYTCEAALYKRDLKVLAALAGGLMLIFLAFMAISPPHEGDSSEYPAVARNILRYGEIREDVIKDFGRRDFSLPHPVTSRGAFFSILSIPFFLLFKKSILSMAIPGAIAYFFIPLLTYICGRDFFGRRVAFWAAFLSLFNVQIANLFFLNEPLEPEMFQALFYLLAIHLFHKNKFGLAGIVAGISCLTKQTSIVLFACTAVFMLAYDRRRETLKGFLQFFLAALLVMSPFLIRNQIVFHHPFYSEQIETAPKVLNQLYEKNMAGIVVAEAYDYDTLTSKDPPPLPANVIAKRFASLTIHNVGWILFGRMTELGHIQGLTDIFSVFLFLFLLAGVFFNLRDRKAALFSLLLLAHCAFMLLAPVIYTRYLIPVFPIAYLLSLYGLSRVFVKGADFLAPISKFILITDFIPFFLLALLISLTGKGLNNYLQLTHMCGWMQENEKGNGLIIGFPYTSLNFLCERPVVAFPSGDVETVSRVRQRFKPEYLYFVGEWKGDRFPVLSGTTPELSNGKSTLFKIGPGGADAENDAYLKGIDLQDYFFMSRFRIEIFPPFVRGIYNKVSNAVAGGRSNDAGGARSIAAAAGCRFLALVIYSLLFLFFLRTQRSGKAFKAISVFALFMASFIIVATQISDLQAKFPKNAPDASVVQLFSFLDSYSKKHSGRGPVRVSINVSKTYIEKMLKNHPDKPKYVPVMNNIKWTENKKFDRTMKTEDVDVAIYFERIPERAFTSPEAVQKNRRDMRAYLERLNGLAGLPGLNAHKSILMNGLILFYR